MKHSNEELSSTVTQTLSSAHEQVVDLISAVKELHGLNSQELNKKFRDSETFLINYVTAKGSVLKIDMEKLVGFLPLHLIALLMSSDRDEAFFRYLLCGLRLLHSLCELAPRHPKLEQILLDDVKVSEQLLDMVFYIQIICCRVEQINHDIGALRLMHSAVVACSLNLLTGFISSQWPDLVHVLLAHPKVDLFMDAAFGAVCAAVKSLQMKLLTSSSSSSSSEQVVNFLCQQCEASLQFLHSLCQQKLFRERLLRNKELCEKGGVLFVAQAILKLNASTHLMQFPEIVASVSRLKAKLLSILLNLCEADSISYLDEVAKSPETLNLAKSIVLEIVEILRTAFDRDPRILAQSERNYAVGFLQLNALRLADIFSDDSNFRSYITTHFTRLLTAIFSLPHGDFLSSWCSSDLQIKEEEGSIEYDSFLSAGWVLDVFSSINTQNPTTLKLTVSSNRLPPGSYEHQRTSLFVKVIANLHCFVPNICEEQHRRLFLNKFMEYLEMDPSKTLPGFSFASDPQKADFVCRNMRSLSNHAESLVPHFLNQEDLQLFRVYFNQLQAVFNSPQYAEIFGQERKYEEPVSWDKFAQLNLTDNHQEDRITGGGSSSPLTRKESRNSNNRSGNFEEMSENFTFQDSEQISQIGEVIRGEKGRSEIVETSGSDNSSTKGKNAVDHQMDNSEFLKSSGPIKEIGRNEEKKSEIVYQEEKQRKKRKRTIMNEEQVELMERAIIDEPDMQRNAAMLQNWADKLSRHGSEVTSSQLKNWLNNRKARLARTGKEIRAASEAENEKQSQTPRLNDSPDDTPAEDATWRTETSSDYGQFAPTRR